MKIDYKEFSELLNIDKPDFSYFKLNENELDKYEDLEYKFSNLLTEDPSDLLIHKENITYFIHRDPKDKEWNLTTLIDDIPTSDIRGSYKECFEDLFSQIKYTDLFIELTRQEKMTSLNNFNEKGEKEGLWVESLKDPIIRKEILFYEKGEKIGKYAKLFNNNEYAEIGNKNNNQVFYYDKNDLNLKGSDSMKVEVLQYFKGKINDVEFQNEQMFNTAEYLIENIENKFGEVSKEFVKDLKENIEYAGEKYDGFSYNVLEESIINSINSSDKFEDLFINYDGDDWKLNDINEKIKNGKYNLSVKNNENDLFKNLQINFEYSEKDLGFPKDTTFRGEEAYKFIKKLIEEDKKQNQYNKTYLDIKYQDYYTDKIKIELGFSQFGGKEKVSDGLEYRLKLYPNGMIQHKEAAASMYHTTTEEIIKTAEEKIKHIDKIMVKFREDEKKLEAKVKATEKAKPEKEKPKRQTRSRIKSKENER